MMKRICRLIHARHAEGYLVNHVSFNTIIPTMSFTDVYYSGEHEQYEDVTKFRVRWQGKQWGIWPILLGDDCHCYKPMHMTYCLLHGVSVWAQGFLGRKRGQAPRAGGRHGQETVFGRRSQSPFATADPALER